MWIIVAASFASLVIAVIVHTFNYARDYHIPAAEVTRVEEERTRLLASIALRQDQAHV
jgi:cytochrome o ubiquinol oxidase subunit 1